MATRMARQWCAVLLSLYESCQWTAGSGQALVLFIKSISCLWFCRQTARLDRPCAISYYLKLKLPHYYSPLFRRASSLWVFLKKNCLNFSLGSSKFELNIFFFFFFYFYLMDQVFFCLLATLVFFLLRVLKHTRAVTGLRFSCQVKIFRESKLPGAFSTPSSY